MDPNPNNSYKTKKNLGFYTKVNPPICCGNNILTSLWTAFLGRRIKRYGDGKNAGLRSDGSSTGGTSGV